MRHWLLALMIVLLPVRGWMGDAMAFSMMGIGQQGAANTMSLMPCHEAASPVAHADGHANMGQDGQNTSASHPSKAHTSCDVCNGPALHTDRVLPTVLQHVQTAHQPVSETFASACPQPGIKPPIS